MKSGRKTLKSIVGNSFWIFQRREYRKGINGSYNAIKGKTRENFSGISRQNKIKEASNGSNNVSNGIIKSDLSGISRQDRIKEAGNNANFAIKGRIKEIFLEFPEMGIKIIL